MTQKFLSGAASLILLSSLASCTTSTGTVGETIKYPTIDEMAAHEKRWGLAPRQVKQKYRPVRPGEQYESTPAPAPRSSAPAPAAAPAMLAPAPEPIQ